MDKDTRKELESELIFYVTAALVTCAAVLVSFKWVYRKVVTTAPEGECPLHPTSQRKSTRVDKSQQASHRDGNGDARPGDGCIPEEDEEVEDIRDLLINHDDILPVNDSMMEEAASDRTRNEGGGGGDRDGEGGQEEEGDIESRTQHLTGPQKTKKLVEEVAKLMSDEQKAEERRIQSEQLEAIFKLVQNQQDTFGIESMEDIQDQFKLYA